MSRDNFFRWIGCGAGTVLLFFVAAVFPALSDDTEIYQAEANLTSGARPKVLVVFDDSGSMSTLVDQQRPPYDPTKLDYVETFPEGRIYWSTDGTVPAPRVRVGNNWQDNPNWFNESANRCASSDMSLAEEGRFTASRARRWVDSEVQQGQCSWQCPAGSQYRDLPGRQNDGCYEYVETTEEVTTCTNEWERVSEAEYLAFQGSKQTRCVRYFLFWCVETGYFVEREQCVTETVTTSEWVYVGDRVRVCEDETVIPGSWQALTGQDNSPTHVECLDDVVNGNPGNLTVANGYPQDDVANGNEYGASPDPSIDWGNSSYTFYTSHYLNWYHDDSLEEPRSRLEIAQSVISSIIQSNPGIDFGLMEFNYDDGGRIARRIIADMSSQQRAELINMVNQIDHAGSTPICESMYEAYRYIAGETVLYGYEATAGSDSRGVYDVLARDSAAESSGRYISPTTDCAYTYIILMTDGFPQRDTGANDNIETLTGKDCSRYEDADGNMTTNCLPQIAEYMANTDLDGDSSNGNQFGITYTIGFATDQDLLEDAARLGKGQYYTANDAQELTEAFQGAITSILSTDTTFTSPAVAVDTFTRTESRDDIFYAMFKPSDSVDWPGNIKKLKLQVGDSGAVLVDRNGAPALDPATGYILDTAATFWGGGQDGGSVESGGVGELLASRDPATRSLYINTGTNGALEAMTLANLDRQAFGLNSNSELYALFGAANQSAFEKQVAWARGYDAFDKDGDDITDEPRGWVMGDILHSQPLVLNYGALGSFTQDNPDIRLLVGTNAGFVHLFGGNDGQEDWAFFPKELVPILPLRRRDALSSDNIYGMDLTPVAYTKDVNGDGTLNAGEGDKVWVYLGMRRGGRSLYALDISNPASPSFKWRIGNDVEGFGELGQTWSQPVLAEIPGYYNESGAPKPVVIFGAGYDTSKDGAGVARPDSVGRGIYIVDADTGALVWSVTPAANSMTNLSEPGLQHSVAAPVTPLDSTGDSLVDRIYFADTGGDLWRVDMPGRSLPTASQDTWQINKLASMNNGSEAGDRRFFNAPDVVRVTRDGRDADLVLIGSGDRTNPNSIDVDDRFYVLRDYQVSPYTSPAPDGAACSGEESAADFRCSLPFGDGSLFDITQDPLNTGTQEQRQVAAAEFAGASGWKMRLTQSGEKSLAKSVTIDGKVYLTTFTPNDLLSDINICEPLSGQGRLYAVDIHSGRRNVVPLGPIIPDTPSLHFGSDGAIRLLLPPGTPAGDLDGDGEDDVGGGIFDTGDYLVPPYPFYWYQERF